MTRRQSLAPRQHSTAVYEKALRLMADDPAALVADHLREVLARDGEDRFNKAVAARAVAQADAMVRAFKAGTPSYVTAAATRHWTIQHVAIALETVKVLAEIDASVLRDDFGARLRAIEEALGLEPK